ncbi:CapA family protein [Blastococcus sp. SYSU DS0510]
MLLVLVSTACEANDRGTAGPEAASTPSASTSAPTGREHPGCPLLHGQADAGTAEDVRIVAVGDVVMGAVPRLPSDGGRGLFAAVKDLLVVDVVLANLDQALTDATVSSKCGPGRADCFAFRTPPAYAQVLADAGFTVVNLANNHTRDFGERGLTDTREALIAAGVSYTGMPGQITYREVDGVRVAIIGFAPYWWAQSLLDIEAAEQLVREGDAKADLVIVTIHAGAEGAGHQHTRPGTETFLDEDRGNPIAFSHAVIDAGADVVLGAGPYVLRGMEWHNGRLIAYSLGNFLGYRSLSHDGPLGVGIVLSIELNRDGRWVGGRLLPSRMVGPGIPDHDQQSIDLVRALSGHDFGGCGVRNAEDGRLEDPTC